MMPMPIEEEAAAAVATEEGSTRQRGKGKGEREREEGNSLKISLIWRLSRRQQRTNERFDCLSQFVN